MSALKAESGKAFTLIELLAIVAVVAIIALLLLPGIARQKARSSRVNCVNSLKQIGWAFRTWANDNDGKYPMHVSVTNGGTMELVDDGSAFVHFLVMSNELSTPKVLICPEEEDTNRVVATTFGRNIPAAAPYVLPFTSDKNLSYFVAVDAEETRPSMWLCGDRNLATNGVPLKHGLHSLGTNSAVGWVKPRHGGCGNIGFGDGSVQQAAAARLGSLLGQTGVTTNRLALP